MTKATLCVLLQQKAEGRRAGVSKSKRGTKLSSFTMNGLCSSDATWHFSIPCPPRLPAGPNPRHCCIGMMFQYVTWAGPFKLQQPLPSLSWVPLPLTFFPPPALGSPTFSFWIKEFLFSFAGEKVELKETARNKPMSSGPSVFAFTLMALRWLLAVQCVVPGFLIKQLF